MRYETPRFDSFFGGERMRTVLREGGNHSWWHNPSQNKRSAVPRHNEISDELAKKICKGLGIPKIK